MTAGACARICINERTRTRVFHRANQNDDRSTLPAARESIFFCDMSICESRISRILAAEPVSTKALALSRFKIALNEFENSFSYIVCYLLLNNATLI